MPVYQGEVPYLTTDQMIEVDRAMMEDFKIDLVQIRLGDILSSSSASIHPT